MSMTTTRARSAGQPKADSLRSTPAGAIWSGLPARDQHLLLWMVSADIVTASLATLLIYRHLRTAQRRLARLTELGILRGFWAAGRYRPRGRHAYVLTRQSRIDLERLSWPSGRPARQRDLPPSAAIHLLATLDLMGAFVASADPLLREGLFAWIPERACAALFGGFLRPDAFAGIRVRDRAIAMFIERDLGTERGEVIADKIRRYRSAFARAPELSVHVGFVVESDRRARTVHELASRHGDQGSGPTFVTAIDSRLRTDPLGAIWTDGRVAVTTRSLTPVAEDVAWPILTPGCLADADTLTAMDDRALAMFPGLHAYLG